MIDRLHADNGTEQFRIVLANVTDQFSFFVGRPSDEDSACVCNRFNDSLQVGMVLCRVPAADRICLVVNVPGRAIGMENEALDVGRREMKDPGFAVVDPDDGVPMMRIHVRALKEIPSPNLLRQYRTIIDEPQRTAL